MVSSFHFGVIWITSKMALLCMGLTSIVCPEIETAVTRLRRLKLTVR